MEAENDGGMGEKMTDEKRKRLSDAEPPKDLYSGVFRGPDWPNGVFDPPPRPDASTGLIEAAEWLETAASRFNEAGDDMRSEYKAYAQQLYRWASETCEHARQLRARDANRSGK